MGARDKSAERKSQERQNLTNDINRESLKLLNLFHAAKFKQQSSAYVIDRGRMQAWIIDSESDELSKYAITEGGDLLSLRVKRALWFIKTNSANEYTMVDLGSLSTKELKNLNSLITLNKKRNLAFMAVRAIKDNVKPSEYDNLTLSELQDLSQPLIKFYA